MNRLSHNGDAIVEAINTEFQKQANNTQVVKTDAAIIGFTELKSTHSYSSSNNKDSYSLDDLSSEIRVVHVDGYVERFELIIEPHMGGRKIGNSTPTPLNVASTWLALNPDRFYVQEDDDGNEIWPVTFPALSIHNPNREIKVTLDRDGTLTWPANMQRKSNATLVYLDNLAIQDTCIQDSEQPQFDTCGNAIGDNIMSYSSNMPNRFSLSEIMAVPYLAIKTIRLDGTGDGSGSAELQMHVDPSYTTYADSFRKKWQYTFDLKRGTNHRPLWFNDFSFFSIFGQAFRLFTDISGTLLSSAESVFSGRNTRTFGPDSRIYETPDVNQANIDYNFTNMRTWSYISFPHIMSTYVEQNLMNYFPIVPLNDASRWRILLMEDDTKYPYASAKGKNSLAHNVQTFNMGTGTYSNTYTKVDANKHTFGSSDDLMWQSGVSNITEFNIDARLGGNSEFTVTSPGGFKYVFTKVIRTSEVIPA